MSPRSPRFRWICLIGLGLLTACLDPIGVRVAQAQDITLGRQVTLFGVLATPGTGKDDPKLKEILPQLRMLLPGHSFKLLKVESKRVISGQSVICDLGGNFVAGTQLLNPIDPNGKIQMRFELAYGGVNQYKTDVSTPPGQIFYVNRMLPSGERLIIGIGAR